MFGNSAFAETPFAALGGVDGSVSVDLTGQAGTSAVGSFTFIAKANVTPSSQVGTSALGTITPIAKAITSLSGNSSTSSLGTISIFEFLKIFML